MSIEQAKASLISTAYYATPADSPNRMAAIERIYRELVRITGIGQQEDERLFELLRRNFRQNASGALEPVPPETDPE